MINIGIISGGGKLPIIIGKNLINKKYRVIFFVIEDHYEEDIYKNFESYIINLKSIKKLLNILTSCKIEKR